MSTVFSCATCSSSHIIFGHYFRDLLILTFMVVYKLNCDLYHFLTIFSFSLASFDFYCGSFTVYRVPFLVVTGAVQTI